MSAASSDPTLIGTQAKPAANREIATIANGMDITRGYLGPLLVTQDTVLQTRGGGNLLVYENVKSDPVVHSAMQQRRLAITKCEWDVEAGGTDRASKKAAAFLKEQLQKVGWDRVTGLMHWGIFYGYAVSELIYGREGSYVTLEHIKVRNRRRFRFGREGDLRLLTYEHMYEGIPAPTPYFWHFATGSDHDDEPYGLGLAHWLYWPVLFKRNDIKFWMIFLEKFGMPTAKGSYPTGATAAEKSALLAALGAIQTDAGVIIPEGMVIELLEAARSGTADYKELAQMMDETIAKVTVGNQASMQGSAGKLGEEKLQGEVRRELVKADADLICESFNLGPARWLTQWNFPNALPPRVYRDTGEPDDLNTTSTRDKNIFSMGYRPTLDYIKSTYGGDWTPITPPKVVPFGGDNTDPSNNGGEPPAFAEGGATLPPDPPARQADQLDANLQPAMDDWIGKIRALVMRAKDLEEVRDGLAALAPDMSLDQYTAAMRQALAAAALAGRYEILREAGTP